MTATDDATTRAPARAERAVGAWAAASRGSGSLSFLVAANVIPLVGVLFLGWDIWTILVLYWIENGIVGILALPRILLARGPLHVERALPGRRGVLAFDILPPAIVRPIAAIFFPFHYGIFWLGHGIFIFGLLRAVAAGGGAATLPAVDTTSLAVSAAALAVSHIASFYVNYLGRREYLVTSTLDEVGRPYRRVVVMHLTILLGAWAVILVGSPVLLVAVLAALKTVIDARAHLREHARAGRDAPE